MGLTCSSSAKGNQLGARSRSSTRKLTIIMIRILANDHYLDLVQWCESAPRVNILGCKTAPLSSSALAGGSRPLTRREHLALGQPAVNSSYTFLPQLLLELEEVRALHFFLEQSEPRRVERVGF